MADTNFEQTCPCGSAVKISGYTSEVRAQIQAWQGVHNKHMNSFTKVATVIAATKEKEANPLIGVDPDYDLINVDVAEPTFGQQIGKKLLKTHGRGKCKGPLDENDTPICCIHNPSDHHMVKWPQNWRGDKGVMERFCPHGIGHPDPDDLLVRTTEWAGVHGCCGCCMRSTNAVIESSNEKEEQA